MKNKKKTTLEYEDAPSGSVYFYNYKEPLIPFDNGFGYIGALIFDECTDQVQCHFCGEWAVALGNHLHKEHNMTAKEYKEKVGLNSSTALIGEKLREKLVASGLEKRMQNLRPGGPQSEETKQKIRETLAQNRAEQQNLNGTCPVQLLDRLKKLHDDLGRTPRLKEIPFKEALIRVYGNMKNACDLAGIPYREPGTCVSGKRKNLSADEVVERVALFLKDTGRLPMHNEMPSLGFATNVFEWLLKRKGVTRQEVYRKAVALNGRYLPDAHLLGPHRIKRFQYTDEELLNFLRMFESIHGRKPSISDTKRRLIPHASRYLYHFGSWREALEAAFGPTN